MLEKLGSKKVWGSLRWLVRYVDELGFAMFCFISVLILEKAENIDYNIT